MANQCDKAGRKKQGKMERDVLLWQPLVRTAKRKRTRRIDIR